VIREDRELLAELAQINTAMAPLALRIMDASTSAAEQAHYAQRLIAAGKRGTRRAGGAVTYECGHVPQKTPCQQTGPVRILQMGEVDMAALA
jgi:hypothetical protein